MFIHIHMAEALKNRDSSIQMITWILLDNQSNVDVFCRQELLSNIRKAKTVMLLQTNAGVLKCDLEGHLANYGWVWFNSQAITNILSLSNVAKKHRVTFDLHGDNIFHVHVKT